jgi:hypothetical protein
MYTQWPTKENPMALCQLFNGTEPLPSAIKGPVCTAQDKSFCNPTPLSGKLSQTCGQDNAAVQALTCSAAGGQRDVSVCAASAAGKFITVGSKTFAFKSSATVEASPTNGYIQDNTITITVSQTAQTATDYVCGTGNHPDWLGQKAPYVYPTCNGGAGTCSTKCLGDPAAGASAGACLCGFSQGTCTVPGIAFPKTCAEVNEDICDQTGLIFSGGSGSVSTRTPFGLALGASKTAAMSNKEWVYDQANSACTKVCDWAGATSNGITNSADGSTTRKASIKSGNCETACNIQTAPLVCNATEVSAESCGTECYSPVLAGLMEVYILGVKASEQMDDMISKGFYQNKSGSECTYGIQCEAGKVLGQLINCGYMELLAETMDRGMCTYLGWGLFSLTMGAFVGSLVFPFPAFVTHDFLTFNSIRNIHDCVLLGLHLAGAGLQALEQGLSREGVRLFLLVMFSSRCVLMNVPLLPAHTGWTLW